TGRSPWTETSGMRAMGRSVQVVAFFVAIAVAGVLVPRALAQAAPYRVTVPVENAAGLYPGSDVMVAGAKAGSIDSISLRGGAAGRGQQLNAGLAAGRQDLDDLNGIAGTLASRDAELQSVIADLSAVTDELARSDRRQELGALITNLQALVRNLADQEAQ